MRMHDHSGHSDNRAGDHHGHSHGVSLNADKRWLTLALALLLAFMVAEVVVGIMARSLALISDAGHMLTDVGSIALALFAIRMAARPACGRYTFGFKRVEILSAQANGLTLLVLAAWFIYEAIRRLISPPPVHGSLMTLVAIAGIVVNLAVVWIMGKANRQSLNIQGSYAHILNDLYAFIATAVAGAI
ncbi:cation diffusion facilitator family transporter, partial [Dyella sp.]|uniref:cation diffusion facilitator family transporter n=1 Tax=Dyella sp. TaxID=1869338 RepID=UPI002FDA2245